MNHYRVFTYGKHSIEAEDIEAESEGEVIQYDEEEAIHYAMDQLKEIGDKIESLFKSESSIFKSESEEKQKCFKEFIKRGKSMTFVHDKHLIEVEDIEAESEEEAIQKAIDEDPCPEDHYKYTTVFE